MTLRSFSEAGLLRPLRGDEAHVQCGTCDACCHQIVVLDESETGYAAETIAAPDGTEVRVLRRKPDGACVYLTGKGCSIHEDRPAVCRIFDCGRWYREASPALRKMMMREGGAYKRMLKAGRRRSPAKL